MQNTARQLMRQSVGPALRQLDPHLRPSLCCEVNFNLRLRPEEVPNLRALLIEERRDVARFAEVQPRVVQLRLRIRSEARRQGVRFFPLMVGCFYRLGRLLRRVGRPQGITGDPQTARHRLPTTAHLVLDVRGRSCQPEEKRLRYAANLHLGLRKVHQHATLVLQELRHAVRAVGVEGVAKQQENYGPLIGVKRPLHAPSHALGDGGRGSYAAGEWLAGRAARGAGQCWVRTCALYGCAPSSRQSAPNRPNACPTPFV